MSIEIPGPRDVSATSSVLSSFQSGVLPKPIGEQTALSSAFQSHKISFLACLSIAFLAVFSGCDRDSNHPISDNSSVMDSPGVAEPNVSTASLPVPKPEPTPDVEAAHAKPKSRLNVIWILLDAGRAQNMSVYGYERETTPNIKQLAAEGTVFEQCYSQANGTSHSVPSYMTGRYFPVRCLSTGSWHKLYRTPPSDEKLLPGIVRENGYKAVAFSAHPWFVRGSRIYEDFDILNLVRPRDGLAYAEFDDINSETFRWLETSMSEPFFLYLHTMDTHAPHYLKQGYDQWVDRQYAANPDPSKPFSAKHRSYLMGLYDGRFLWADYQIGILVEKLKSLGIYENTILVIGADHGECVGEDGYTLDHPPSLTVDQLFHVPLVMRGPGIPAGKRVAKLVENVDIVPTLIELLSLETNTITDGQSLVPLMHENPSSDSRRYVVASFPDRSDDKLTWITIRSKKYRLEYLPETDTSHLWQLPDNLENRKDVASEFPDEVAAYLKYVRSELFPKWYQYVSLPRTTPRPFSLPVSPAFASPPQAFVSENRVDDSKWTCNYLNLTSTPETEDCPPITMKYDVPNGFYRVEMELRPFQRGSALKVTAQTDSAPKLVVSTRIQESRDLVTIGEYEISDGFFTVTIEQGAKDIGASLSTLRFIPDSYLGKSENSRSQSELEQQVEALGYL
ncbi:MAG: sulfatase [Candidatus Hydrogenedentes bacterium]|nr:sulfatase [Candidatus Hydrogenedentota bacterium]